LAAEQSFVKFLFRQNPSNPLQVTKIQLDGERTQVLERTLNSGIIPKNPRFLKIITRFANSSWQPGLVGYLSGRASLMNLTPAPISV
jgi:hypothetical protein